MSDSYGQSTMYTTQHQDGRIKARSESLAAKIGPSAALAASLKGDSDGLPVPLQDFDQRQGTGPTADQSLVTMSDPYGQATIITTQHEDGRIEARSESIATEEGTSAALAASVRGSSDSTRSPQKAPALSELGPVSPAVQPTSVRQQLQDAAAGKEPHNEVDDPGFKAAISLTPASSPPASTAQGTSEASEGRVREDSEHGSGYPEEEDTDVSASLEGHSPTAGGELPDDFDEGPSTEIPNPDGKPQFCILALQQSLTRALEASSC